MQMRETHRPDRLITDMFREIRRTRKRFLSLFLMNLLAVGFLAGLRMTAPDMQRTMDAYYDRQHFMDVRILSALGLTEEDLAAAAAFPGVQAAEGSRSFDARSGEESVTVLSLPAVLNLPELEEGRLPEAPDECVTEAKVLEALGLEVGSSLTVDTRQAYNSALEEDPLVRHTYTIVGMVRDPLYVSRNRGGSQTGSGSSTGFVMLPGENFTAPYYTSIYLELEGVQGWNCYTDAAYEEAVDDFIDRMEPLAKERARLRRDQIRSDMTFTDLLSQLLTGDVSNLEIPAGDWYVLDRNSIRSYVEFTNDAERMSDLATVFPVVFFLVAALSSLTSMTRMVEEHRTEIGSLKALGFSDAAVSMKYLGYAAAASLLGGAAGLLIGGLVIPELIYYEWGILYLLPPLQPGMSPVTAGVCLGAALLATAGAAWGACRSNLLAQPAELLRPRAPRPGRRILLERITPVWSRLSFLRKVSMRNLFRYQKRLWMTTAGIAGCMALLVTGFGIRDSIFDVLRWQFDDLMLYSATARISEDLRPSERAALQESLDADPGIGAYALCMQREISVRTEAGIVENVTLTVTDDWETLGNFIRLYPEGGGVKRYGGGADRSGAVLNAARSAEEEEDTLTVPDGGVLIDERMQELLHISEGETILLRESEELEYPARVSGICENYIVHYVYMTAETYREIFGEKAVDNTLLLGTAPGADPADVAARVSSLRAVRTYNRIDEVRGHYEDSMKSLDAVVWIILIAAAALAFLVLFNLTNINVTERLRELATLKVLGFYDGETASYVYRENIFLTLLAVLLGIPAGRWLHRWLIGTIEMDYLLLGRGLHTKSYLYAAGLTILFSLSVNFFAFFSIQKIDMVESLKSVE
ncbi:MAG: ABC transporter permease [Lachnospiraceae bacterium]|nr:ABC transporter permease [Lachnospiraceae bacterium]